METEHCAFEMVPGEDRVILNGSRNPSFLKKTPKDQRIQCANVYLPGRIQLGNLLGQGGGEGHGCKTTLQTKTSRSAVGEIKLVVKLDERRKKWRALGKKNLEMVLKTTSVPEMTD